MTELLIRLFAKRGADERAACGKLAGKVGIICNVLLCAFKFAAGVLSGSVSVTADALNNLSDASSGVISLLGFKLAEKTADEEHPYGHARYEYLAGLMVSLLVLVIGAELLRSSVIRIITPEPVEFTALTLAVLAASIAIKLWLMVFYKKIARHIGSETLAASAADSRNDVISTAAVLAAAVLARLTGINADGVMGAAVALFIIFSGIGLLRDAISPLLGKAPDAAFCESIRQQILAHDGVLGTHDLMLHDYGPGRRFASVHVEVAADTPLVESHETADRIEREFAAQGLGMTVHIDPVLTDDSAAGEARRELSEIVRGIDERLSVHDVRLVYCAEHTRCVFDCVVPHGAGLTEQQLREEIARFMRVKHPDYVCYVNIDSSFAPIQRAQRLDFTDKKC